MRSEQVLVLEECNDSTVAINVSGTVYIEGGVASGEDAGA